MVEKTTCFSDEGPNASDNVSRELEQEMEDLDPSEEVEFTKSTFNHGNEQFAIGCIAKGDD